MFLADFPDSAFGNGAGPTCAVAGGDVATQNSKYKNSVMQLENRRGNIYPFPFTTIRPPVLGKRFWRNERAILLVQTIYMAYRTLAGNSVLIMASDFSLPSKTGCQLQRLYKTGDIGKI